MSFQEEDLTASFNEQMEVLNRLHIDVSKSWLGIAMESAGWKYLITTQPVPDAMVRCPQPCTMPEMRRLAENDNPFRIGFAAQIDEMLIEPGFYLMAVMDDVMRAGGSIVVREFRAIKELQSVPEGLIFNCTGLGAKALFNDEQMNPLPGQLTILLPEPEVTYATGYEDKYMFPRKNGILLGGTHELGNWSTEPDLSKKEEILMKQKVLFSQMRTC
jgi:D-amino-acid oxidase